MKFTSLPHKRLSALKSSKDGYLGWALCSSYHECIGNKIHKELPFKTEALEVENMLVKHLINTWRHHKKIELEGSLTFFPDTILINLFYFNTE